MKFGNSSPWRHSWRCSSLWRQVALSWGEDPCCACEGVYDSPLHEYQHSSFHVSHCLSRLPGDASHYAWTSSNPSMRTAEKGSLGLTSTSAEGGIAQPAPLVYGERTLKPRLGRVEGLDGHLPPAMKGVQRRASNSRLCFPLVQKWAPVPQTGDKLPKVSGRRMSVWFLAKWGHPSTVGF